MHPRVVGVGFLVVALGLLVWVARRLAARSARPWAIWGAAGYLALLHLICVYGLAASSLFGNALPQLTLFTFPLSMLLSDTHVSQGFALPGDLALNYLRYVVCFGGVDALVVGGFLWLVTPERRVVGRRA